MQNTNATRRDSEVSSGGDSRGHNGSYQGREMNQNASAPRRLSRSLSNDAIRHAHFEDDDNPVVDHNNDERSMNSDSDEMVENTNSNNNQGSSSSLLSANNKKEQEDMNKMLESYVPDKTTEMKKMFLWEKLKKDLPNEEEAERVFNILTKNGIDNCMVCFSTWFCVCIFLKSYNLILTCNLTCNLQCTFYID